MIGDTSGHDVLCCQYKGYSSAVIRAFRCCTVKQEDLDDLFSICENVTMGEVYDKSRSMKEDTISVFINYHQVYLENKN